MVYATVCITILSYIVWLHHFFTMGSGASVNSFFGIATMIISIPTGAKLFNWLFTMYRGRIRYELPMMWTVAFMLTFAIGGMTGVLLAVPPADFVLHNSLFLVAHFHNVIIGGVLFGLFAGIAYWWPKAFGFRLDPFWGKVSFWCWVSGFWVAFMPLYVLGLMGVTRRMRVFDDPSLQIWFLIAALGAVLIACGIAAFLLQIAVSIWKRDELRDTTGDPWDGRTLEWATSSPPPAYNFAFTPVVHDLDAWWDMKSRGYVRPLEGFRPIHMPKNTGSGRDPRRLRHRLRLGARSGTSGGWRPLTFAGADRRQRSGTPSTTTATSTSRRPRSPRPRTTRTRLHGAEGLIMSATAHRRADPASTSARRSTTRRGARPTSGFWIYLMSDCLIFAVLFATYGVLGASLAGGPGPRDLFELPLVALNTTFLLISSITYGFAMLAVHARDQKKALQWLAITGAASARPSSRSSSTSSPT